MADLNRLESAAEVQLVSELGNVQIYRNLNVINLGSTVKNSPGLLHGFFVVNTSNALRYLKIYDKAAPPVVGTDTPRMTLAIPGGLYQIGEFSIGLPFQFGIGIGATTGIADSNTASPATNNVIAHVFYS
jgi:hypothetical protein